MTNPFRNRSRHYAGNRAGCMADGQVPPAGRGRHGPPHRGRSDGHMNGGAGRHDQGHGRPGHSGTHDGHGRRHGRRIGADDLRLLLLGLIVEQPRHGYDLIRAIDALTGGAYAPSAGMVYPTLSLLEEMDHIVASPDGARKVYAATDAGRADAESQSQRLAAIIARLQALGERQARAERSPISRAMRNLKLVLMNRADELDPADATVHQIAAILDDATQRIEQL